MTAEGHDCVTAENGADGLRKLDDPTIGLVLLGPDDARGERLGLPGRVRQARRAEAPVVVLTASLSLGASEAECLRGYRIVPKPISLGVLLTLLEQHLPRAS